MGQISLPRLNRLSNSMFWESYTPYDTYHYKSLKSYIFYKYFIKYFFRHSLFYYSQVWGNFNWFYTKSNSKRFTKHKLLKFSGLHKNVIYYQPLKFYLYTYNNRYYIFFITLNIFNKHKRTKSIFGKNLHFLKKLTVFI